MARADITCSRVAEVAVVQVYAADGPRFQIRFTHEQLVTHLADLARLEATFTKDVPVDEAAG